jgi:hypothetical protein
MMGRVMMGMVVVVRVVVVVAMAVAAAVGVVVGVVGMGTEGMVVEMVEVEVVEQGKGGSRSCDVMYIVVVPICLYGYTFVRHGFSVSPLPSSCLFVVCWWREKVDRHCISGRGHCMCGRESIACVGESRVTRSYITEQYRAGSDLPGTHRE